MCYLLCVYIYILIYSLQEKLFIRIFKTLFNLNVIYVL